MTALLAILSGLVAVAPAPAAVTAFNSTIAGGLGRLTYQWTAPAPAGHVYVVFASTTTGKDWVYQLSSDTQTTASGTVVFNPRRIADANCTTLCVTAKVAGTGPGNYLPNDVYMTQLMFLDANGTITKSSTSSLTTNLFTGAPDISSPRGQRGVDPNGLTVDFDLPQSMLLNSRLVTFTGKGACSASSATVRLLAATSMGIGTRIQITYDPFTATAMTRRTYAQTGSPTPYQVYPQSSAGPTWTPGSSGSPTPSWTTPAPSPTPTTSFSSTPITTIPASTDGKLIRGCSYDVTVDWTGALRLPGYPDEEPYISQFNTWYANSTTSPAPTPTGVCASAADAFTASPTPTCPNLQPQGHARTASFVIPDVPDAPTAASAGYGDGTLPVTLTAPADNHAPITGYQYSLDGGEWSDFAPPAGDNPYTITGLTNGTEYTVRVRAVNGVGPGPASEEFTGTPMTTPAPPTGVQVSRGDGEATVSFAGPVKDGGSPITEYQYSVNGGTDWVSADPAVTTSPFTIVGLTNGTTYDIKVRAVNTAGPGAASTAVAVTPCTTTGKPGPVTTTLLNGAATISVPLPAAGHCPIDRYQYSLDDGAWTDTDEVDGTFTVTGLSNGRDYDLRVRVAFDQGTSPASDPVTVNPQSTPGAPTGLDFTAGDRGGTIAFTDPDDGGRTIIGFQYQSAVDGPWQDVFPAATGSPVTVLRLTNGQTYQVRIRAVNSVGPGEASEWITVVPGTVPTAPRNVVVSPGDGSARVTFTAPADDGGRTVTNYEYSLDGGQAWTAMVPAQTSGPIDLAGLVNGTEYDLRVRAVNALGAGDPSRVVAFSPYGTATAPTMSPVPVVQEQKVQTGADDKGKPPARIKRSGVTVLTQRGALTNAGQVIRTRVNGAPQGTGSQGEVRYFTVLRGPRGEVAIRTFGQRNLRIVVRQSAPATDGFTAYRQRTVYVDGVRQP